MSIFFCGEVSKEEIIIYLQNKKHSLINNLKLRNDILTKNHFLFDLLVKPTIKIKRIAPRRILEEKNIFVKNEKIEKKCEKILENTQIYKQILKKNTKRNSGYKNIRIFYRSNLKNNVKKVEKIESKVKFSDFIENKPHNNGEIKSILRCKTNKVTEQKTPIKKRNIFVLSQTPEEEFSFEYEVLN